MEAVGTDRGNSKMAHDAPFVDFYEVLQVNPNCSAKALESAYHLLAKKFHPDHSDSADVAKLTAVIEAYRVLRSPDERSEYNLHFASNTGFAFSSTTEAEVDAERSALSDADAHAKILQMLYKQRRENASDPGVPRYLVQDALNCSDEIYVFHLWYLREKGFILTTEQGTLAITIEGVDHVIAMSRTTMRENLRITQSSESLVPDSY
jgi:curved DNA-binding protein